jgi:hypothetical protein
MAYGYVGFGNILRKFGNRSVTFTFQLSDMCAYGPGGWADSTIVLEVKLYVNKEVIGKVVSVLS